MAPAVRIILIWASYTMFLLYPLARIFYDAVTDDTGAFTLGGFHAFFTDGFYLRSLWNSLLLGIGVVIASSALGIGVAFLLVRYEFWGRGLFSYLTLIPIISPPWSESSASSSSWGGRGR